MSLTAAVLPNQQPILLDECEAAGGGLLGKQCTKDRMGVDPTAIDRRRTAGSSPPPGGELVRPELRPLADLGSSY